MCISGGLIDFCSRLRFGDGVDQCENSQGGRWKIGVGDGVGVEEAWRNRQLRRCDWKDEKMLHFLIDIYRF